MLSLRKHVDRARFLTTSPVEHNNAFRVSADFGPLSQYDNIGFDFGMWKAAVAEEDFSNVDEAIFVNSSIVGPFADVGKLFSRMNEENCDAWGLSGSTFPVPHLQTYFFAMRSSILNSIAIRLFFDSVLMYNKKWAVIANYEIGLSVWLEQHGFRTQVAFPLDEGGITGRLFRNSDPSIARAAELVNAGCPYVKAALLNGRVSPDASIKQRTFLAAHRWRLVRALARRGAR